MKSQLQARSFVQHRILIVDDDPDTAELVCKVMNALGHECRAVLDGLAAIDAAETYRPDIVLVDLGLADVDGYAVARALRARDGTRKLHLAAMTGWGRAEDRTRALAAGFDQHILKPVALPMLRRIIDIAEMHQ